LKARSSAIDVSGQNQEAMAVLLWRFDLKVCR
jgi:hypothetical protein